jgi:hypothetical protein
MSRKSQNDPALVEVVTLLAKRKFAALVDKQRNATYKKRGPHVNAIVSVLNEISNQIHEITVDPNSFEKVSETTVPIVRKNPKSSAIKIVLRKDPEWEKLSPEEQARRRELIKKAAQEARERVSHSCNAFLPSTVIPESDLPKKKKSR